MTDINYDADSIFQYLPSFWREHYKSRDQLEAVYEAALRALDVDFAVLAQTDDSKDGASLPSTTRYPVVYQDLPKWVSNLTNHQHARFDLPWPAPVAGTHNLYLPAVFVPEGASQVFCLNGVSVPTSLFQSRVATWYTGGQFVIGTILSCRQTTLNKYVSGDFPTTQASEYSLITDVDDITTFTCVVDSFRNISLFDGDGTKTDFAASQATIDTIDSEVYIDSVDVLPQLTVTYQGAMARLTPKTPIGKNNRLELRFSNGEIKTVSSGPGNKPIDVPIQVGATLQSARIQVNFRIKPDDIVVRSESIVLKQPLFDGAVIRVSDPSGTQVVSVYNGNTSIRLPSKIDPTAARVFLYNIDLTVDPLTDSGLSFSRAPATGVRIQLREAAYADHTHKKLSVTVAAAVSVVSLPDAPTGLVEVYLNGRLLAPSDYTISNQTILKASGTFAVNDKLIIFYQDFENPVRHFHSYASYNRAPGAPDQSTFELDKAATSGMAEKVYLNGLLASNYAIVNETFVRFDEEISAEDGAIVQARIPTRSFAYSHDIPIRTHAAYNYSGQLVSATTLQDKLADPSLTLDSTQFQLDVVPGVSTTLSTDFLRNYFWFVDARVDEKIPEKVWGQDIGLIQVTSPEYARLVAAIRYSLFQPSTTENLENYGSILLGSNFTTEEAVSAGISGSVNGQQLNLVPVNAPQTTTSIELLPGVPTRIKEAPQKLPRFWAVNKLVDVKDGADLKEVKWLAHFAADLSGDYGFAKRLDVTEPLVIDGYATSFDNETGVLTDLITDFQANEVRPGDLICFNTLFVTSETSESVGYLFDGKGFSLVSSLEYLAPSPGFSNGRIRVRLPIAGLLTNTFVSVGGADGSQWQLSIDGSGTVTTSLIDASPPTPGTPILVAGDGGTLWSIVVDPTDGALVSTAVSPASVPDIFMYGDGARWKLFVDLSGALTPQASPTPVLVSGTDGNIWSITTNSAGLLIPVLVGAGSAATVYAKGSNGGLWMVVYNPIDGLVGTLVTPTPATPPPDLVVYGANGTVWKIVFSDVAPVGTLSTVETSLASLLGADRFAPGKFFMVSGSDSWSVPLAEAAYQVSASYETNSEFIIEAPWIKENAPSPSTLTASGLSVSGVSVVITLGSPLIESAAKYTLVKDVLDKHRLVIDFEFASDELYTTGTAYGQGGYGKNTYGGGVVKNTISSYKLFSRRTRTMDAYLYLDEALPEGVAWSKGETIELLNSQFAEILRHNVFAVEYDWRAPRTLETLEYLGTLVDRLKSAETRAIIYTEAYKDSDSLIDNVSSKIQRDDAVDPSFSAGPVVDAFTVGESFVDGDNIDAAFSVFTANPYQYTLGPAIETMAAKTVVPMVYGGLYLVGPVSAIGGPSLWFRTFTNTKGLENEVLRLVGSQADHSWVLDSGTATRISPAIRLIDRSLRIDSVGVPNRTFQTPQTLTYTQGDPLSVNFWYRPSVSTRTVGSDLSLLTWGPFNIGVRVESDGSLRLYAKTTNATDGRADSTSSWAAGYQLSVDDALVADPTPPAEGDPVVPEPTAPTEVLDGRLILGIWHNITVTYSVVAGKGKIRLYINGILTGENSTPGPAIDSLLVTLAQSIHINSNGVDNHAQGDFQQIMLFVDHLLSTDKIEEFAESNLVQAVGVKFDGTVLAPEGATSVLQFFDDELEITDYSGNGFVAKKEGPAASSDWRVSDGAIADKRKRVGDLHSIKPAGLIFYNGAVLSQGQVLAASFDESVGSASFTPPAFWYTYSSGGWQRVLPSLPSVGASIEVDDSTVL